MTKAVFVTNRCAHHRVKVFEELAKHFDIKFLFFSGGNERYRDAQVKLYTGNFKHEYLTPVYILPSVRITPSLITRLFFGKYDVFVKCINGRLALPITFLIAKLKGKPFVLWQTIWHHPKTFFHKISFPFLRFIWRHSDAFVVSGLQGKEYLKSYGIDEKKIFVIWSAVDNSLFNKPFSQDDIDKFKSELKIEGKKVILFSGRILGEKGVWYLIKAFEKMQNENVVLIFIGEGSEKQKLKDFCHEKGIKNVLFAGFVKNDQMYKYYAIADLFVLPSITTDTFKEPWGLVINEAMNQGCPIVSTDAVGAAVGGLVQDGVNGYVVKEKNVDELLSAMRKVLNNEELRMSMSEKSKEIIKDWTYKKMCIGFKDAIEYASR